MRGISPIISTVMVIAMAMAITAFVSPWVFNLVTNQANDTSTNVDTQMTCQNTGYDFDTTYASSGLLWNFSQTNTTLRAKIKNTGTINLYNFSFEITINDSMIYEVEANITSQKTRANPLKPGQSAIIAMNITEDYNDTLTGVKVLNGVCPYKTISQEL